MSVSTVVRRCRSGELPAVTKAGSWRVFESAISHPQPDEDNRRQSPGVEVINEKLSALPLLLSVAQVADLLGESEHEVRVMIRQDGIPHRRIGPRRIPLPALADWLLGHNEENVA